MKIKKNEFWVSAGWDEEHGVYFSESNIPGLFIETETLGAFEEVMFDIAPELIFENVLKPELAQKEIDSGFVRTEMATASSDRHKVPEQVPFVFKGAAPRSLNLAMA